MTTEEQALARTLKKATNIRATPPPAWLKWINDQGDNIVTGAETVAGIFDGNPAGEIAKAIAVIPPAKARALGQALAGRIKESAFPEQLKTALSFAQQRYPRLFGHLNAVATYKYAPIRAPHAAFQATANKELPQYVDEMVGMGVVPEVTSKANTHRSNLAFATNIDSMDAYDTVGHELTHAAQQLRKGRQFSVDYSIQRKTGNRTKNTYERNADAAGQKMARIAKNQPTKTTDKLPTVSHETEITKVLTPTEREHLLIILNTDAGKGNVDYRRRIVEAYIQQRPKQTPGRLFRYPPRTVGKTTSKK